ncbi:PilX N-terminal domain-containing pilus assembly protein [Aliikangiella sp. IMCC44653]
MNSNISQHKFIAQQSGAALFVSLVLLLILTVIGLSSAQRSNMQEQMAANTHVQHKTFNASESALGAFFAEANTGNKTDTDHILYKLRVNGKLEDLCINKDGQSETCDSSHLDGDKGSVVVAQLDAEVTNECNTLMCSGYSLGRSGSKIGCRIFEVNGRGAVNSSSTSTTLWAYEVTACAN